MKKCEYCGKESSHIENTYGIFEIVEQVIQYNLVWVSLHLINLFNNFKYSLQFNFYNKI